MAEKTYGEKKEFLGLGTVILLIILGVFIIWVLTKKLEIKTEQDPVQKTPWPAQGEIPSYGLSEDN